MLLWVVGMEVIEVVITILQCYVFALLQRVVLAWVDLADKLTGHHGGGLAHCLVRGSMTRAGHAEGDRAMWLCNFCAVKRCRKLQSDASWAE